MPDAPPDLDIACLRIAECQRGLITAKQALGTGMTKRAIQWRVQSGRWTALLPGVLRVTETDDPWLQELHAVRLWTGDGVVTHRASAGLWGFFDPGIVEVTTMTRKCHPQVITHYATLDEVDVIRYRHLLVTTPTRTR